MRKSVSKRIRITRQGKVMRRSMNTDHFRTRKTTKNIRKKKGTRGLDYPINKILNH